ncbi:MAG TPA: hypothetical protein VMH87_15710, partial [Pseudomonadales bacterium]|nr:hypothetical protein [Pseudomonadales bacterium]
AQYEAMHANAAASLQDIAQTTLPNASAHFTYSFPPGTMTLFTFSPAAAKMQASPVSSNKFVLQ